MSSYELRLEPIRVKRDPVAEQPKKRRTSPRKGKTWDDFLSRESQERCAKGWENLNIYRKTAVRNSRGKSGTPGRQVVAVFDDGRFEKFESLEQAGRYVGVNYTCISVCCKRNKEGKAFKRRKGIPYTDHRCMGVRFYYEDDPIWITKIGGSLNESDIDNKTEIPEFDSFGRYIESPCYGCRIDDCRNCPKAIERNRV